MADQKKGRRRTRLVPPTGIECFEIRAALWFRRDGSAMVGHSISTPDEPEARPPLHEVLGVLRFAEAAIIEAYAEDDGDDD